jgi:hypothetical protein
MQAFETGNELRSVFLRMRGHFILTPSPQSSPVEGEEEEKN